MTILKCKMCGGDITIDEEKSLYVCEYCGSMMTLPKVSDEQRAASFNRGNHFRRIGEFDKALAVYENLLRENEEDAEAHWCCALCRFGIEYVEDPISLEYIPTCHRASFDNFLEDIDYLSALEYSNGITKRQYQKDAAKIAEVQRGILATSQKEEPFDVFICYKETDDQTKERTHDSLDAQDIYYQLTQEGYRVFYSRITLEDKAGSEYEPYIFAALNSAKVMIVVGSKKEYFDAVWVKNEWSRYLSLVKNDRSKLLIPCYKGIDPYDLPEQLSVLQSYDMTKIGFVQDLIRGIKKVIGSKSENANEKETISTNAVNVDALIKRGSMALEDEEWEKASQFFDSVLNMKAEEPEAWLGLALANVKVCKVNKIDTPESFNTFERSSYYQRFLKFAVNPRKEEVESLVFEQKKYIEEVVLAERERQRLAEEQRLEEQRLEEEQRLAEQKEKEREREKEEKRIKGLIEQFNAYSKKLVTCMDHTVLLRFDGTIYACGNNDLGACNVSKWNNITDISVSNNMTVGIQDGNIVLGAGLLSTKDIAYHFTDDEEILESTMENKSSESTKKIVCGNGCVYILHNGEITFRYKGYNQYIPITQLEDLNNVESMSSSLRHIATLTKNGKVISFGENEFRQCDTGAWTEIKKVIAVDYPFGIPLTLGINKNGDVFSTQYELHSWKRIIDLDAGSLHVVGLDSFGRVHATGENKDGQCNVTKWEGIVGISAGLNHTVALTATGRVEATGDNSFGQCNVSDWQDVVYVTASGNHTIGLKSNGEVLATGDNYLGQCNVKGWKMFYPLEEIPQRIEALVEEKNKLNSEIATLHGVFASKRRKEKEEKIEKIENEIDILSDES